MAERASGAAAPATLAGDVRRRHRRRVARNRAAVGVAAAAVVAVAITPAYRSFQADPVGSPTDTAGEGTALPNGRGPSGDPKNVPVPGTSSTLPPRDGPGTGSPRPDASRAPGDPAPEPAPAPGAGAKLPRWIGYLPTGLKALAPCADHRKGGRTTTACKWSGAGGWAEVHVTRGPGLTAPGDVPGVPSLPSMGGGVKVHGRPAVATDRPDRGRQIAWIERPGVGVTVLVGPALRDQLMSIAEGVRP